MFTTRAVVSLIAVISSATVAQSACTQAHVNNKTWKLTAYEATQGALIYCKFRTSGGGSISLTPGGCENSRVGTSTDFNSPTDVDIQSGSITMVPGDSCTYDATLNLVDGSTVMRARVVMESGKTVANGNFLLTGNGGGTVSIMRQ